MGYMRQAIIIALCTCLTACGFHLRGQMNLPPGIHDIYLQTNDPYGQLAHNITDYLHESHVDVVATPAESDATLQILQESQTAQLLSVGGTQQTRQYTLILSVVFQLKTQDGRIIYGPETISDTRSITIESSQILGGSNQANNLYTQMYRSIVYILMNHLASQKVALAVAQAQHPQHATKPRP